MAHDPQTYRFFLMTLDPVHIGTGGARLGRVDNPIAREPGTNLPKIPGTSLHGAIRAYAAHRYGKPQCAGQGQQEGRKHCGQPTCPICYTFGYARDQEGGHAGVVAIGDARILLFPVYSMVGPVWVASPTVLKEAGIRAKQGKNEQEIELNDPNKARWSRELWKHTGASDDKKPPQSINLGWLMVEQEKELPKIDWPPNIPDQIRKRVVLVSNKLFSQIVNSNLEVRTSVAINPETGAAEERALFTYEAIPRATVLWMDVVVSDYRALFPARDRLEKFFRVDGKDFEPDEKPNRENCEKVGWALNDSEQRGDLERYQERDLTWSEPLHVLEAGLEWLKHLGVGGMGTRGFGRIQKVDCLRVENQTLEGSCEDKKNVREGTEAK